MSLRALLNDEPQDPISALSPRPSAPSTAPNVVHVSSANTVNPQHQQYPFPTQSHSPPTALDIDYPRPPTSNSGLPQTNGNHRGAAHGSPAKKSRRNDNRPHDEDVYQNGHPMDVEMTTNGAPVENKTGSTGRSNLVRYVCFTTAVLIVMLLDNPDGAYFSRVQSTSVLLVRLGRIPANMASYHR
jgi:hypothetical protein